MFEEKKNQRQPQPQPYRLRPVGRAWGYAAPTRSQPYQWQPVQNLNHKFFPHTFCWRISFQQRTGCAHNFIYQNANPRDFQYRISQGVYNRANSINFHYNQPYLHKVLTCICAIILRLWKRFNIKMIIRGTHEGRCSLYAPVKEGPIWALYEQRRTNGPFTLDLPQKNVWALSQKFSTTQQPGWRALRVSLLCAMAVKWTIEKKTINTVDLSLQVAALYDKMNSVPFLTFAVYISYIWCEQLNFGVKTWYTRTVPIQNMTELKARY
jgi:hypothetical protein